MAAFSSSAFDTGSWSVSSFQFNTKAANDCNYIIYARRRSRR